MYFQYKPLIIEVVKKYITSQAKYVKYNLNYNQLYIMFIVVRICLW